MKKTKVIFWKKNNGGVITGDAIEYPEDVTIRIILDSDELIIGISAEHIPGLNDRLYDYGFDKNPESPEEMKDFLENYAGFPSATVDEPDCGRGDLIPEDGIVVYNQHDGFYIVDGRTEGVFKECQERIFDPEHGYESELTVIDDPILLPKGDKIYPITEKDEEKVEEFLFVSNFFNRPDGADQILTKKELEEKLRKVNLDPTGIMEELEEMVLQDFRENLKAGDFFETEDSPAPYKVEKVIGEEVYFHFLSFGEAGMENTIDKVHIDECYPVPEVENLDIVL